MNPHRQTLASYRLEQAEEALRCAQLMMDHGMFRPSVNRAYYGMFYSVLALLAVRKRETSKHSGAIALFDREFVKSGLFETGFSQWLHEAFDLRQRADYREMFTVSEEQARSTIEHARSFVAAVKAQISDIS